jgi:D-alanine-D-alanine ligase
VAVVFGGRSSEHSISCISAGSVIAALDPERYDVVPVGIATDGRWVLESGDPGRLSLGPGGELPTVTGDREVTLTAGQGLVVTEPGDVPHVLGEVDVVFPVMHGPWGQDGTLQGLLEMTGVRYVGAGVLASAVGTDKHFMKQVFLAAGLPVLPYVLVRPRAWERDPRAVREAVHALGFPVFVKPARGGSSIGITKVSRAADLDAAIAEARRFDPKVIVEAAIVGREVECGVLQYPDGRVEASLPAELHIPGEPTGLEGETEGDSFYDFDTKYLDDVCTFDLPALLPDADTDRLRALAVEAFHALDARGLSRVDFFVTEDGPVINEVNTMPGFTPISMYPQMWAASGVDYRTLLDTLVRTALAGC